MAVATTIPRYDKTQKILIGNEELTLIDHLKNLRTAGKVTKKKISNLIKQNDSWYSQIERSGKHGDDNRQKTLYRPDLVDIISIVKFGANNSFDLDEYRARSEHYLDNEIHAFPLGESLKKLELYQINHPRTDAEQLSLYLSLRDSIFKHMDLSYDSLSHGDRNEFLNHLKEMNASMKIDPLFIIFLSGLPLAEFLYEANEAQVERLMGELLAEIDQMTIKHNTNPSDKDAITLLQILQSKLNRYVSDTARVRRQKYTPLPPDEIVF